MKRMVSSLILCSLAAVGCGANPALRSQVDALQKESDRQNAEIANLSAEATKCHATKITGNLLQAGSDAVDMISAAWNWTSTEATRAWNASQPTLEETKARAEKCYHEKVALNTFQDYREMAAKCWADATTASK